MRLALLACPLLVACATNDPPPDDSAVDCSTVMNADTFVVGLEKMGAMGQLDFKLMSADPAPPARGDNTWVVQINAMSAGVVGNPMTGIAGSITATPFMPAHGHGSPKVAMISAATDPGQYTVTPVNMWMPGVWETTIAVDTGTTKDQAVYRFCIPQ